MDLLHFCRSVTVPKVTELLLDAILFSALCWDATGNKDFFCFVAVAIRWQN